MNHRNSKPLLGTICFVFVCIFVFQSCGTTSNQKASDTNTPTLKMKVDGCNAVAVVRNYTSEPGCQYLLELEDKTLLLPGELPATKAPFYEGAGLKIGYEILDNDASRIDNSLCKKHDRVAKITCVEQYIIPDPDKPASFEECKPIKNPYKFEWMRDANTALQPKRINEYKYTIGYLYEFEGEKGSVLYDCLGNKMCDTADNADCKSLLETLTFPKAILVLNN